MPEFKHFEDCRCDLCWRLSMERKINRIIKLQENFMAQIDELNAAIAGISTDLTALSTDVQTLITDFQNAQGSGSAPDLSAAIAQLTSIKTQLDGIDASVKTAVTPSAPPAA